MELVEEIGFSPVDCGRWRNARLLESLADFTRFLMMAAQGPYMTITFDTLPEVDNSRLGGRQPSESK